MTSTTTDTRTALMPITCQRLQSTHPFGPGIFKGESPLSSSFPLFLFQLTLVIIIIHTVRFLIKPLRQPRIVAEVIGGIIIGPSVLGQNKKFAATVFPMNAAFTVKNFGVLGFTFFLFLTGIKMDVSVVKNSGKKQVYTALIGVLVPFLATEAVAFILRRSFDSNLSKVSSIGAVTSSLAITVFPVLYPVLKELNLLSSEIGREALATAIIGDVIGINAIVAFEAGKQGEVVGTPALFYLISVVGIGVAIVFGVRRLLLWVVHQTPEGQAVDQVYVVVILLGAFAIGFISDMFGVAIGNGPMWLGLVIPDGPPLGTTVLEKFEAIANEIFMPLSFAYVGLTTDVFSLSATWSTMEPLLVLALVGYITKLVAYVLASLFFETPLKDSITLALIMSLRGQVEVFLCIHWMDKGIIGVPGFTLVVLLSVLVTATATPLIGLLYNPSKPYMVNKRRTIQHTPQTSKLRIVACIHNQDSVTGIINLLEVSNPTPTSPFAVSALRLVELVGRASPVFIDHENNEWNPFWGQTDDDTIHSALHQYQESRGDEVVTIHSFTSVSPRHTMYQDICELALSAKATLVLLPFHKDCLDGRGETAMVRKGVQSVNLSVMSHAPCTVAILVDRGSFREPLGWGRSRLSAHKFAMVFLGGADSREALSYVDRMAGNPEVSVTVMRFLSLNSEGEDEMEKKLDDGLVTWFWVKNERNERVVYKEVVVRNGEETVAAIRAMNESESHDLWVVGRKQGINPLLLEGLHYWSENLELGIVGDFLASVDFGCTGSVLVVQQQILRAHGMPRHDGNHDTLQCRILR